MILIFESTTAALNAESLLEDWGLDVKPVPIPKSVSNQCGLALAVFTTEPELYVKALTVVGIIMVLPAADHAAV